MLVGCVGQNLKALWKNPTVAVSPHCSIFVQRAKKETVEAA